jgi:hypothetical protein
MPRNAIFVLSRSVTQCSVRNDSAEKLQVPQLVQTFPAIYGTPVLLSLFPLKKAIPISSAED